MELEIPKQTHRTADYTDNAEGNLQVALSLL